MHEIQQNPSIIPLNPNRVVRPIVGLIVLFVVASVLFSAGCDLGTYNRRLKEPPQKPKSTEVEPEETSQNGGDQLGHSQFAAGQFSTSNSAYVHNTELC